MKASDVAWSAAGLLAPLAVALIAIPPLLATLGAQRFGLLSLAWALTAMSGLFDLGIGRAATRLVAVQRGRDDANQAHATLNAALPIATLAGTFGALLMLAAAAFGAYRAIRFEPALDAEVQMAVLLLAPAVPLQTLIATYRGVSEACQRFRGIGIVRIALGIANFAGPWAVSQTTTHLGALIASLLAARIVACLAYRQLAQSALPAQTRREPLAAADRQRLWRSGGWFSISAVVSPLLVQADRFVIGALLSAAAVTAYAVPFDIVTQLLIGVSAVASVAFPSIAAELQRRPARARQRFLGWTGGVAVVMALLCALLAAALPAALPAWAGTLLPAESITVGRWLCLGVWINSLGAMYFAWLHANDRFRATALLHLVELPLYAALLWTLLPALGVTGAAMAWVARVAFDSVMLAWLSRESQNAVANSR